MARAGHVYVMDAGREAVKIGFSRDPKRRSASLGNLQLLHATEWLDEAGLVEGIAHSLLARAGKHVTNEIFNVSLVEAVKAINDATSIANRTKADVRAAKAAAGKFGRPKRFERDGPEVENMRQMLRDGRSVARVAKAFNIAPATVRNYIPTTEIQKLRSKK